MTCFSHVCGTKTESYQQYYCSLGYDILYIPHWPSRESILTTSRSLFSILMDPEGHVPRHCDITGDIQGAPHSSLLLQKPTERTAPRLESVPTIWRIFWKSLYGESI